MTASCIHSAQVLLTIYKSAPCSRSHSRTEQFHTAAEQHKVILSREISPVIAEAHKPMQLRQHPQLAEKKLTD